MRACVIFNPCAKGEKARRFRQQLDSLAGEWSILPTTCAGDARRLACNAVNEGFTTLIAAGGDGTVNEVLNGIGDAPDGFERAVLGVWPLGTVNVFARELAMPLQVEAARQALLSGEERQIDLPVAEYQTGQRTLRRYFAQLAGAGLDARAVEMVNWPLKKRAGMLAYIWAGLQAMRSRASRIHVQVDGQTAEAELVVVGNGRFYGGNYNVFPTARLDDGQLEVRAFPVVNWMTLARCSSQMLTLGTLPGSRALKLRGRTIELTSDTRTAVQLDGELAGTLPAKLTIKPRGLRVLAPPLPHSTL